MKDKLGPSKTPKNGDEQETTTTTDQNVTQMKMTTKKSMLNSDVDKTEHEFVHLLLLLLDRFAFFAVVSFRRCSPNSSSIYF